MIEISIDNKRILVTPTVVDIFRQFRQFRPSDHERGGIVIGQLTKSTSNVLVNRVSIATLYDKSDTHYFHRDKKAAQQIIDYEYYNSRGKNTYLGEWHTHPAQNAQPSGQDLKMIKNQFSENDVKSDFILLFIIGQINIFVGLYNGESFYSCTLQFHKENR